MKTNQNKTYRNFIDFFIEPWKKDKTKVTKSHKQTSYVHNSAETSPTRGVQPWKVTPGTSHPTDFVLMLIPEEVWNCAGTESAEHRRLLYLHTCAVTLHGLLPLCFHLYTIILLSVDCGVSKRGEISQTDCSSSFKMAHSLTV